MEGAVRPLVGTAGWFRHTLKADPSPREDEPFAKVNGDGSVAKTPWVAEETQKTEGGAPKPTRR
jgi:hypothetical protein